MPPGFLRLGRGLPAVIMVRGLLPGAHFGSEAFIPLMLVEQRKISLLLAGAVLTIGSIGWTTGSWLQSRPWLKIRQDRLITYGCLSVAVGVSIVAMVGIWPALWFGLVGVGWIFAGLGMGLATSSTSLAVMTLSDVSVQGRNASSLNVFDALGTGIFVGLSGTIFAALRPTGNMSLTFGVVYAAMVGVALLAVGSSLRIGRVRNELLGDGEDGSATTEPNERAPGQRLASDTIRTHGQVGTEEGVAVADQPERRRCAVIFNPTKVSEDFRTTINRQLVPTAWENRSGLPRPKTIPATRWRRVPSKPRSTW